MNRLTVPISMLSRRQMPSARTTLAPQVATTHPLPSAHTRPYSGKTTSAPKSAEEPSATSGGSRSKEAVETGSSPTAGPLPDTLAEGDARGRTGGGAPLKSSKHAPAQPKISNGSVPGGKVKLSKEQQAEVDEHNRDFEAKHGKAAPAGNDKVDKSFWSGTGSRENKV